MESFRFGPFFVQIQNTPCCLKVTFYYPKRPLGLVVLAITIGDTVSIEYVVYKENLVTRYLMQLPEAFIEHMHM